MKKVSCISLAGCCCGTNNASKFQNPVSTKLFVGISVNPSSKKICLNSCRTFIRGCKAPLGVGAPFALKLYGFRCAVFHAPVASISAVRSVSSLTNSLAYFGPLLTLNVIAFLGVTSFRFLRSASTFASGCVLVCCIVSSCSLVVSTIESVFPHVSSQSLDMNLVAYQRLQHIPILLYPFRLESLSLSNLGDILAHLIR